MIHPKQLEKIIKNRAEGDTSKLRLNNKPPRSWKTQHMTIKTKHQQERNRTADFKEIGGTANLNRARFDQQQTQKEAKMFYPKNFFKNVDAFLFSCKSRLCSFSILVYFMLKSYSAVRTLLLSTGNSKEAEIFAGQTANSPDTHQ